jgi:RNA polymerase sigma-32 factor
MRKKEKDAIPPAAEAAEAAATVLPPHDEPEPLTGTELLVPTDTFRHYIQQVTRYPRLTRDEEHELAVRYHKYGDSEAAYRLVTGNLRLVVRIAFDYRRTFLNLLDLVQEGNIGLIRAVRKYDPFRGVPFSAYSGWWIRAYMLKYLLDHWSIVKVGTTNARRRLFFNLKKEKERLELEGIGAGPKLLAETFNASEQDVIDVGRALSSRDVSLDAPIPGDSDKQVWETIPVAGTPLDDQVARSELREILRAKLAAFSKGLKEKERYVLNERLVAEEPATLQAIGDRFSMTREAARLIEKKVIAKLRDYLRTELKDLRVFEVSDDEDHEPESPATMARRRNRPGAP